jgi:hypothetical protein
VAYAGTQHVRAAAGNVGALWRDDTHPGEADLETFLDDGSALVDVALSGRGVAVPISNASAVAALRPVVVDYALVRALDATFQGGSPSDDVAKMRDGAQTRWDAWLASVADESNSVVDVLLLDVDAGLASSLWSDEPDYGLAASTTHPEDSNFRLAPYVARGDLS